MIVAALDRGAAVFYVCCRSCNAAALPRVKVNVPGTEVHLTQPGTGNPTCPEHATCMVSHKFELWEINHPVEVGFRCANLTCGIIYIEGTDEGFYTLEPNGDLTPYP
jgi:hypothetical protein